MSPRLTKTRDRLRLRPRRKLRNLHHKLHVRVPVQRRILRAVQRPELHLITRPAVLNHPAARFVVRQRTRLVPGPFGKQISQRRIVPLDRRRPHPHPQTLHQLLQHAPLILARLDLGAAILLRIRQVVIHTRPARQKLESLTNRHRSLHRQHQSLVALLERQGRRLGHHPEKPLRKILAHGHLQLKFVTGAQHRLRDGDPVLHIPRSLNRHPLVRLQPQLERQPTARSKFILEHRPPHNL